MRKIDSFGVATANLINQSVWFTTVECNLLFRYDLQLKKIETVCEFDEKGEFLFIDTILYQNKLIFIPYTSKKIYVYDMNLFQLKSYTFNIRKEVESVEEKRFITAILHESCVYFIPYYTGDSLVVVNLKDDSVIEKQFLYDRDIRRQFSSGSYIKINDKLYLELLMQDKLICIELGNLKYQILTIEGLDDFVDSIFTVDNKKYYLWTSHGRLCRFGIYKDKIVLESNYYNPILIKGYYYRPFVCEKKYGVFDIMSGNTIIVDIEKFFFKIINSEDSEFNYLLYRMGYPKNWSYIIIDHKLMIMPMTCKNIMELDLSKESIICQSRKVQIEDMKKYAKNMNIYNKFRIKCINYEDVMGLDFFVNYIELMINEIKED